MHEHPTGQSNVGDPHELVTVYTVNEPTLAELLRAELELEGIRCEVSGQNQAGLTGVLNIQVLVQAADADRARSVLKDWEGRHRQGKGSSTPSDE